MQVPGALHGTDDVVAPLYDDARDVADAVHVVEELAVGAEESAVDEIMAFDACECLGEAILVEFGDVVRGWTQIAGGAFPDGPRLRRTPSHLGIITREAGVVGAHHVGALSLRNEGD